MKSFYLALVFGFLALPLQAKELHAKSVINQKAPPLVVGKWLTDKPSTAGKFVIIDFWATWCGDCRHAIPELNAWQKKYADRLVVIGLSDESEDKVRPFATPKPEYSSAIDVEARMKKTLNVREIPHLLVIDPQGIVRWEGFPFREGEELTDKVLAGILTKYAK